MSHVLWIINKDANRQTLEPNYAQTQLFSLVKEMEDEGLPVRIIILKARREGISTGIAGWIYLKLLCLPNVQTAVIAHEKYSAEKIFEIYRRFHSFSVEALKKPQRYNAKGKVMHFEDESRMDVLVAKDVKADQTGKTGRSAEYRILHRSEVAFWGNAAATSQALKQTVTNREGTAIFDESTGNGFGDYFYTQWERAMNGDGSYRPLFLPWLSHEEYTMPFRKDEDRDELLKTIGTTEEDKFGDECRLIEKYEVTLEQLNWRRYTIGDSCEGNVNTFIQEYPTEPEDAFRQSGQNVFKHGIIKKYFDMAVKPLKTLNIGEELGRSVLKDAHLGLVRIWEPPKPYNEYIIGTDNSEGLDSGDWNVGVVVRRLPLKVVARLQGYDGRKIDPLEFGDLLYILGRFYQNAWICPENNFDNGSVGNKLIEMGYQNLITEIELQISQTDRVGWRSTPLTRKRGLAFLIEVLHEELIGIPDKALLREAWQMIYKNGRAQAPRKGQRRQVGEPIQGFYDDELFALIGALWAHHYLPPPRTEGQQAEDEERLNELIHRQQRMAEEEDAYLNTV